MFDHPYTTLLKSLLVPLLFLLFGCGDSGPKIKTGVEVKTGLPIEKHLDFSIVVQKKKAPVVFLLQGSGSSLTRSEKWSHWFNQHNISTVIIKSAQYRKVSVLYKYNYSKDLMEALDVAKKQPSIDLEHYAVMGFSKGGTASLESGAHLKPDHPEPNAIFALYPGSSDYCPNTYQDVPDMNISIFYGDKDQWGATGARDACQEMAQDVANTSFYLLKGAHHGYDGDWSGEWECCGKTFTSKPNPKALEKTQEIVLDVLKKKWGI